MRKHIGTLVVGLVLVVAFTVLQQRDAVPAHAVKAAVVECFGFHAAQTDDVAELNIFNDSGQKAKVEITFFRGEGDLFTKGPLTLAPHEVNDAEAVFALGGSNGPIQRAVVKVLRGPSSVAVDGSVHHSINTNFETEREVTCQKG